MCGHRFTREKLHHLRLPVRLETGAYVVMMRLSAWTLCVVTLHSNAIAVEPDVTVDAQGPLLLFTLPPGLPYKKSKVAASSSHTHPHSRAVAKRTFVGWGYTPANVFTYYA